MLCKINKSLPNLFNTKIFLEYKIIGISKTLNEKYQRRLAEMGFVNGTKIKVIRKSFQGKTLLVEIRNYVVSIRKNIAEKILVSEI